MRQKMRVVKFMAHNLESMFYVRVAPWHGLGVCVEEALTSGDALRESGLTGMYSSVRY